MKRILGLILLGIIMFGCVESESKIPDDYYTVGYDSFHILEEINITLSDNCKILCVSHLRSTAYGLSCDWDNKECD